RVGHPPVRRCAPRPPRGHVGPRRRTGPHPVDAPGARPRVPARALLHDARPHARRRRVRTCCLTRPRAAPRTVRGMTHPLDPITADEITAAVGIVKADGRVTDAARFARVVLDEPPKSVVRAFAPGDPMDRRVRLTIVPGPGLGVIDAVVSVTKGEFVSFTEVPDVRPALLMED